MKFNKGDIVQASHRVSTRQRGREKVIVRETFDDQLFMVVGYSFRSEGHLFYGDEYDPSYLVITNTKQVVLAVPCTGQRYLKPFCFFEEDLWVAEVELQ